MSRLPISNRTNRSYVPHQPDDRTITQRLDDIEASLEHLQHAIEDVHTTLHGVFKLMQATLEEALRFLTSEAGRTN